MGKRSGKARVSALMTSRPECTDPRVNIGGELQSYSPPAREQGQEGKRLGSDEPQVLDVIPRCWELEGLSGLTAGREHSDAWGLGAWRWAEIATARQDGRWPSRLFFFFVEWASGPSRDTLAIGVSAEVNEQSSGALLSFTRRVGAEKARKSQSGQASTVWKV